MNAGPIPAPSSGGGNGVFGGPGAQTVRAGAARLYSSQPQTITGAIASLGAPPTGAAFIVDVKRNGVSIYTTPANRPTIEPGSNVSAFPPAVPDVTALATGDYLTVDILQIGNVQPGYDLTVQVLMA